MLRRPPTRRLLRNCSIAAPPPPPPRRDRPPRPRRGCRGARHRRGPSRRGRAEGADSGPRLPCSRCNATSSVACVQPFSVKTLPETAANHGVMEIVFGFARRWRSSALSTLARTVRIARYVGPFAGGRVTYASAQLGMSARPCNRGRARSKMVRPSYVKERPKMSWNSPGWIPGAPIKDDVPACGRCGHNASAHHDATSCSVRGSWRRRCRCSGYIRPGSTTPAAPGIPAR